MTARSSILKKTSPKKVQGSFTSQLGAMMKIPSKRKEPEKDMERKSVAIMPIAETQEPEVDRSLDSWGTDSAPLSGSPSFSSSRGSHGPQVVHKSSNWSERYGKAVSNVSFPEFRASQASVVHVPSFVHARLEDPTLSSAEYKKNVYKTSKNLRRERILERQKTGESIMAGQSADSTWLRPNLRRSESGSSGRESERSVPGRAHKSWLRFDLRFSRIWSKGSSKTSSVASKTTEQQNQLILAEALGAAEVGDIEYLRVILEDSEVAPEVGTIIVRAVARLGDIDMLEMLMENQLWQPGSAEGTKAVIEGAVIGGQLPALLQCYELPLDKFPHIANDFVLLLRRYPQLRENILEQPNLQCVLASFIMVPGKAAEELL